MYLLRDTVTPSSCRKPSDPAYQCAREYKYTQKWNYDVNRCTGAVDVPKRFWFAFLSIDRKGLTSDHCGM